jgi:peptidoglycan L-alanyl-D-glutamate endopeptidase CwlK
MIDYKAGPMFWQRSLKCAGFYTDIIDGDFGSNSLQAAHDSEQASIAIANQLISFDGRSESNIQTLLPMAQKKARDFMKAVQAAGVTIKIISGTRTFAEQEALYRQGRDLPGNKVTNARGGQSNHNFGVAWDIGIFQGGQYLPESPLYRQAGEHRQRPWPGVGRRLGEVSRRTAFPDRARRRSKAIATSFASGQAFV